MRQLTFPAALLVAALCLGPAEAAQPVAATAARLNAAALRGEMLALRARLGQVPKGVDADAWSERQQAAFAKRWRPRVERAAAAGDPFARWVMHDCRAVPELQHAPADDYWCHYTLQAEAQAPMPELAGTGFARAVALSRSVWGVSLIEGRCRGRPEGCQLEEAERELHAQLDVAENEGVFVHVRDGLGSDLCPRAPADQPRGEGELRCWRLQRRLLTMRALAPRSFVLSMDPPGAGEYRGGQGSWGSLGPVPDLERSPMATPDAPSDALLRRGLVNPRLSAEDRARLERFQQDENAFYSEVWNSLERMRASIDAQLARDPRWRLLLQGADAGTRPPGAGSVAHWRAKAAKRSIQSLRDAAYMGRYVGQYRGGFISTGTREALTVLWYSGNGTLGGGYLAVRGEAPEARVEVGRIDNCLPPSDAELICTWDDAYGFGSATFLFNADASEFRGEWNGNYQGTGFNRFTARDWNDLRGWTGKRE